MRWQSALAIYLLFWVLSAFLVLPFGMRTAEEAGHAAVPGQAESAPAQFAPARIALRTTLVSILLFGAFFLNYRYGWVTAESLDFFN
jgi:predicted secreted protein